MKRILFSLFLMVGACEEQPYRDPFLLDEGEIANAAAFKEASKYIIANWESYSHGHYEWNEMQEYLKKKGLRLKKFKEFHLEPSDDTCIRYTDDGYILAGDTVYTHSIIYTNKNLYDIKPTSDNRMLLKKIDTNLYYIVLVEKCPGC